MPVIGSGDRGWPAEPMLDAILESAFAWFNRGLALRALKSSSTRRRRATARWRD
jgi:hypothetical protein